MGTRHWLVLSGAANVVLLGALLWPRGEVEPTRPPQGRAPDGAGAAGPKVSGPFQGPAKIESLAAMRDVLGAAGVAPEQIAQVLGGMIQKEHHRKRRAAAWWKGTPYGGDLMFADPMDMHEDRQVLLGLMDETALAADATRQLELDHLPEGKRAKVAGILRDYAEVNRANQAAGLRVASDQARDELLGAELRRDLREVLSPEEYLEHTLRDGHSKDWIRLRIDAGRYDLSEGEFRDTARALSAAREITDEKARLEAVEKIHDELRAAVGPERIFKARAKNCFEYTQLRQAQIRFGFPQAATNRVVETWRKTYQAAEALRADKKAEATAKQAAWRSLAAETRRQTLEALGTEAGEEYVRQSMTWLREWEDGADTRMGGGLMGQR